MRYGDCNTIYKQWMDYQLGFVILQKLGFTGRVHPYCISLFKNYIRRSQGERAIFVDPSSIHPLGLPWKDRKVSDFLCSNNAVFLPVSNNSHVMSMINCWERWWWSRKCTFKSDLLYSYLAVLCIQFWQELFKKLFLCAKVI